MQSSIADLMMHLHLIVSKARSGMPTQARPMNQKTSMWMMSKNCQSYLQTGHSSRTGLTTIPCSHHDHPRLVLGQTINSVSSFCRSRNSETSNYGMLRTEGLSEQGGRRSKDEAEAPVKSKLRFRRATVDYNATNLYGSLSFRSPQTRQITVAHTYILRTN
jgi:hypothetical protein